MTNYEHCERDCLDKFSLPKVNLKEGKKSWDINTGRQSDLKRKRFSSENDLSSDEEEKVINEQAGLCGRRHLISYFLGEHIKKNQNGSYCF